MSERKYNEEKYNKLKVEGDDVKNAIICDEIADDSITWNPREAVYWRKKAIELIEKHYGKENIMNTFYYDKIVNDLLEQGSYQQADKWNKKSKKIKVKEKGEYAIEIITNERNELDIHILLKRYDMVVKSLERVKESLQKNSECNPSTLYSIYLEFARREGYICVREKWGNAGYFADRAMCFAKEIYGEDSLEIAEVYRIKALGKRYTWHGEKENAEALQLLKMALLIAWEKGGGGSEAVRVIFQNIEDCWSREVCWQECIKWAYHNISKEFAIDIMGIYPEHIRKEMSDALRTIMNIEDK